MIKAKVPKHLLAQVQDKISGKKMQIFGKMFNRKPRGKKRRNGTEHE